MSICNICVLPTNKSTRQNISCLKCSDSCCLKCVKTYLQTTKTEPTCMFCFETLSKYDLIKMKIPKSYIDKEYKLIRQEILFNNDKINYSESFKFVEEYVKINNDHDKALLDNVETTEFCNSLDMYTRRAFELKCQMFKELSRSLTEGGEDTVKIIQDIQLMNEDKKFMEYKVKRDVMLSSRIVYIETKYKLKDIHKRILNEQNMVTTTLSMFCQENDCNGMLNRDFNCITCKKKHCSDCNTIAKEGHTCNPDDKKSFKMIKNQTKSCPKCFIPIHKIHGCDQMFCTGCRTPFSWQTGEIIKSTRFFHNPHYFEHLDNGGENINFLQMTNNIHTPPITFMELKTRIENSDDSQDDKRNYTIFTRILYRNLLELVDIGLYNFTEENNKRIERVKFLSNKITKQKYIQYLNKEDTKIELLYNIDKIYLLFYTRAWECIQKEITLDDLKRQILLLAEECSSLIKKVCVELKSSRPFDGVLNRIASPVEADYVIREQTMFGTNFGRRNQI